MKIAGVIGIPSLGMVSTHFLAARIMLQSDLGITWVDKIVLDDEMRAQGRSVDVAEKKQYIAEFAVENGADWVLYLDDDVIFPPHTLLQLLHRDKDIVGGVYWSKSYPSVPLIFKGHMRGTYKNWHVGDFFKVDAMGMGLTLIKTKVFKAMPKPWFSLNYTYQEIGDKKDRDYGTTEDLYFYKKARDHGFEVWCDTSIQALHYDKNTKQFFGIQPDYPQAIPASEIKPRGKKLIADIGCGEQSPYFEEGIPVRMDIREEVKPDILCDVRQIPEPDEKYDIVYCMAEGERVLTKNGFKNIEDVIVGDEVWTHKKRWQKVSGNNKFNSQKELYRIITACNPQGVLVTENHPILVKKFEDRDCEEFTKEIYENISFDDLEFVEAKDLKRKYLAVSPIVDYIEEPLNIKVDEDLMRLIGYFLSGGSLYHKNYTHQVEFHFNTNELEYLDDIQEIIFDKFGIAPIDRISGSGKGVNLKYCSKELYEILTNLVGDNCVHEKKLPSWILWIKPELQMKLIEGFFRGSGSKQGNRISLSTTSKELAEGLQFLLLRNGIFAGLSKYTYEQKDVAERFCECGWVYNITYTENRDKNKGGMIVGDKMMFRIYSIEKELSDKPVYGLQVENDESYYGGLLMNHNSSHTLEHFSHSGTLKVLKEWLRILKVGGELRLVLPNLEWACRQIVENNGKIPQYALWVLYGQQNYCLHPDTPVLKSDLTWCKAKDIKLGDKLLAFDENPPRMLREAKVTFFNSRIADIHEITTEDGSKTKVSAEHKWLRYNGDWITADNLGKKNNRDKKGKSDYVLKLTDVWTNNGFSREYKIGYLSGAYSGGGWGNYSIKRGSCSAGISAVDRDFIERVRNWTCDLLNLKSKEFKNVKNGSQLKFELYGNQAVRLMRLVNNPIDTDDFKKGFIAGFFDAEGTIDKNGSSLSIANSDKYLIDLINNWLNKYGFKTRIDKREQAKRNPMYYLYVRGGGQKYLEFMGLFQPAIKRKFDRCWKGKRIWSKKVKVVSNKKLGRGRVISIGTSTNTIIANGFITHNSKNFHAAGFTKETLKNLLEATGCLKNIVITTNQDGTNLLANAIKYRHIKHFESIHPKYSFKGGFHLIEGESEDVDNQSMNSVLFKQKKTQSNAEKQSNVLLRGKTKKRTNIKAKRDK